MTNQWRDIAKEIKNIGDLPAEVARLRSFERFVPLGHYYSPEITPEELVNRAAELFAPPERELPGIELRTNEQLRLLEEIAPSARAMGFPAVRSDHATNSEGGADSTNTQRGNAESASPGQGPSQGLAQAHAKTGFRYWWKNEFYLLPDALVLAGLMQKFRPARIVEVGSGFSSAVMLDVRERALNTGSTNACHLTFVEPFPSERLNGLLRPADRATAEVLETTVQRAPMAIFDRLEANDVLFIDSSHVSKIGSDVNHLFFNVLPRLKPGVLVHVHDVFTNFEYPRHWLEAGRRWNEAYLLRSFLQFNSAFELLIFNNYLGVHEHARFARALGLNEQSPPARPEDLGAGLWMRKTK